MTLTLNFWSIFEITLLIMAAIILGRLVIGLAAVAITFVFGLLAALFAFIVGGIASLFRRKKKHTRRF